MNEGNRITREQYGSRTHRILRTYAPVRDRATQTDYQGKVTTYQHDATNRLSGETNPEYLEVSYHYDGAGRLLDRILSNSAH